MLIWSGWGILIPLIVVLVSGFFAIAGGDDHAGTGLAIGLILSGVIVWTVGKKLNGKQDRTLIDPETGQPVRVKAGRHSLFFIPMQWWAPVCAALGIALLAAGGG